MVMLFDRLFRLSVVLPKAPHANRIPSNCLSRPHERRCESGYVVGGTL